MIKFIEDRITEIISLCKSHHVISIALFGSVAKATMHLNSDVDFLVQFSEELDVLDYADNYFNLLENLEKIVGKKVDLICIKSLKNQILIEDFEHSNVVLYSA
jgi:predicted nucleotidyltransferase